MKGDMDLAATGTVTWVDGKNLLAFGHPFLSMGPVDMPMAQAEVLTVLPSFYRSFKFAGTGPVLGSITQDRSTGIYGTFGARAPMVPITVRMTSNDGAEQVYRFEAVHNPMLTPILDGPRHRRGADDPREAHGRADARLEVDHPDERAQRPLGLRLLGPPGPRGGRGVDRPAREFPDVQRVSRPEDRRRGRDDHAQRPPAARADHARRSREGKSPARRDDPDPRRPRRFSRGEPARGDEPDRAARHAAPAR